MKLCRSPVAGAMWGDACVTPPCLFHREGLLDVLHRIVQLTQEDDCVSPACPQSPHPAASVPGCCPDPSQHRLRANLPPSCCHSNPSALILLGLKQMLRQRSESSSCSSRKVGACVWLKEQRRCLV